MGLRLSQPAVQARPVDNFFLLIKKSKREWESLKLEVLRAFPLISAP